MVYLPNIPQSGDTLPVSQPRILGNFQEINTDISHDHVSLTDDTAAQRGKHNKVSLPQQGADPASTATESVFYTKQNSVAPNVAAPFFHAGIGGSDMVYSLALVDQFVSLVVVAAPSGPLANFAGLAPMTGTLFAYNDDLAVHVRTLLSPFIWTGTTLYVPGATGQLSSSPAGTLQYFTAAGTLLSVNTTSNVTVNLKIMGSIL